MGTCILPGEIIEKILSHADGETLLICQEVSPEFASAVFYLTSRNIWKKCCLNEITRKTAILQIISKLYPHYESLNCPINWKLIYESWSLLKKILAVKNWNVTVLNAGNKFAQIAQVSTHGNLILALLKYKKNFASYNKIQTINDMNVVVDKSCRFYADSLYITPLEDINVGDGNILLYCEVCKLIGVPAISNPGQSSYPKIFCDLNKITVEHSNKEFLCFSNTLGLFDKSKCISTGKDVCPDKQTIFLNISFEFSHLYIACDDIYREFFTFESLHAKVTCAKFYANLIFLGTDTGMLYGYFCQDKFDVLQLQLKDYAWSFNVCSKPLLSIDVMVIGNEFGIVCCDNRCIYKLTAVS